MDGKKVLEVFSISSAGIVFLLALGILACAPGIAYAHICLDDSYDGDEDSTNEIRLASECTWGALGFKITFKQTIDNLTHTEWYIVDYISAGYYKSPVKPWCIYTLTYSSCKSCVDQDKGADFTRTKPTGHAKVSVATAPACVPGWFLLDTIKDFLSSVDTNEVELAASLTVEDVAGGYVNTMVEARSICYWDSALEMYRYTYMLTNNYAEPMSFFINSAPSPGNPSGWVGTVDPCDTVVLMYELSATNPENDPVEYDGSIDYTVGEDTVVGLIPFATISPDYLTPPVCGDERHPIVPGDMNHDCYVNMFDLAVLGSHWMECTDPEEPCEYLPY